MSDGVLSIGWRNKLLKRLGLSVLLCFRCQKEITVDCKIHISQGYGRGPVKNRVPRIYHKTCFESMFFD